MTTRFPDRVLYRDQSWNLAWTSSTGLFSPRRHGHRAGRHLQRLLGRLYLRLPSHRPAAAARPAGAQPGRAAARALRRAARARPRSTVPLFSAVYNDLQHPLPFSGGLLLGRDRPEWPRPLAGMHPAWKYREVLELVFTSGELAEATDCSGPLTAIRHEVACGRLSPNHPAGHEELFRRIASLFRHPYSNWRDRDDPSELLSLRQTMAESSPSRRRGPRPWSLTTLFHHLFRRTP